MSKTVCPFLALLPIPSQCSGSLSLIDQLFTTKIFSIVDVTSEFLVIENENTISWQKMRYTLPPPAYFTGQK
jgi:hypothetical protein